jgi:hypothetical protein
VKYANGLGQVLKTQFGAAQTDMAETDFRLPGLASIPISPSELNNGTTNRYDRQRAIAPLASTTI